jgi:hypothetical protein
MDFCLIFAPGESYDEPEILPSSTHPICWGVSIDHYFVKGRNLIVKPSQITFPDGIIWCQLSQPTHDGLSLPPAFQEQSLLGSTFARELRSLPAEICIKLLILDGAASHEMSTSDFGRCSLEHKPVYSRTPIVLGVPRPHVHTIDKLTKLVRELPTKRGRTEVSASFKLGSAGAVGRHKELWKASHGSGEALEERARA